MNQQHAGFLLFFFFAQRCFYPVSINSYSTWLFTTDLCLLWVYNASLNTHSIDLAGFSFSSGRVKGQGSPKIPRSQREFASVQFIRKVPVKLFCHFFVECWWILKMQKARCCDQPTLKKHTIETAAADMRFICIFSSFESGKICPCVFVWHQQKYIRGRKPPQKIEYYIQSKYASMQASLTNLWKRDAMKRDQQLDQQCVQWVMVSICTILI